jgi:hypothetical protein
MEYWSVGLMMLISYRKGAKYAKISSFGFLCALCVSAVNYKVRLFIASL